MEQVILKNFSIVKNALILPSREVTIHTYEHPDDPTTV